MAMAAIVTCACGFEKLVTLSPVQGLPLHRAQRQIEVSFEDLALCFVPGGPGACPLFQKAIEAAIDAGRFQLA